MNRRTILFSVIVFIIVVQTFAKPPIRYMTPVTLGIEYNASLRGQLITEAEVNALERQHLLKLHYSPVEYGQFYLGAGMDRFEVEYEAANKHFDGKYGFSPIAGLSLNSPALVRSILRVTANIDYLYLNSKDSKKFKYSGSIVDLSLGIIAHAGALVDIEAGVLGHFIDGTMKDPAKPKEPFSNPENVRGYFNFTLCSPVGAFAQVHIDASPATESNFDNGPVDATIGVSLGILILSDQTNKKIEDHNSRYFQEYKELEDREKEMTGEM